MVQQVKVYTTPTCPWCKKAKQFLDDNKISYQSFDVASDKAARTEMVSKSRQLAVPVIDIDGEIIIGFDEKRIRAKLNLTSKPQ